MKKFFIILLSVFLAGCGVNTAGNGTTVETATEHEKAEDVATTATGDAMKTTVTVLAEKPETTENAADEASQEQDDAALQGTARAGKDTRETKTQTMDSESEKSGDRDHSGKTDVPADKKQTETIKEPGQSNAKSEQTQEKSQAEKKTQKEIISDDTRQSSESQPEPVSYSPDRVVSLAIAKCQAGGMVTTTDNLANLLAEGSITQEEYDEYYPYDGLGYYSVFVETDLNEASTTSGQKLNSEEAIAQYIADMLLLETEPVFNIGYAGVTGKGGTDYYEFRCYR